MIRKTVLLLFVLVLFPVSLRADYLEIRRPVYIYTDPDKNSEAVLRLDPAGMNKPYVELISADKVNGYYQVSVDGESGWVYQSFVRRVKDYEPATDNNQPTEVSRGTQNGYNFYFGNLHSHTGESGDDGEGTYRDAFDYARNTAKLDFLAITMHAHMTSASAYSELQSAAKQFSVSGKFVAIAGQEFSTISKGNHVNVFEANSWISPSEVANGDFKALYEDWIPSNGNNKTSLQFNHPNTIFKDNEYGIDDYNNDVEALCNASKDYACMIEVIKTDSHGTGTARQHMDEDAKRVKAYLFAINNGWRVAPTANQDNHRRTWGTSTESRTCVIAKELTRDAILEGIRERRCYASEDEDINITFRSGDAWMGSIVSKDKIKDLYIKVDDDGEQDAKYTAQLYEDEVYGQPVSATKPTTTFSLKNHEEQVYKVNPKAGTYYLLKVTQSENPKDSTEDNAWTAPIWVK